MRLALRLPRAAQLGGHELPAGELALVDLDDSALPAGDKLAARNLLLAALGNPHLVDLDRLDAVPKPADPTDA